MTSPRLSFLVPLLLSFSGARALADDPPVLGCAVANGQATLARAVTGDSYVLESSSNLVDWSDVTTEGTQAAGKFSVSLPLAATGCFFRLRPDNVPARVTVILNETDEDLVQTVPGSYSRPTTDPSPWGGVCQIPLSAGFTNTLGAGHTTVPGTDNSQLTYHWRFRYPENRNAGVEYIDHSNLIHGEDTSTVTIDRNALPDLGGVVGENEWRAILTITNNAGPTPQVTEFRFRFRYFGSSLTIALPPPP